MNIKAWDKRRKCWCTKDVSIMLDGMKISLDVDSPVKQESDVELVYGTGIKDKNGIEIFEGDIVKYWHGETSRKDGKTTFKPTGFIEYYVDEFNVRMQQRWMKSRGSDTHCQFESHWRNGGSREHKNRYLEIIGNKRENPEKFIQTKSERDIKINNMKRQISIHETDAKAHEEKAASHRRAIEDWQKSINKMMKEEIREDGEGDQVG